MGLDDLARDRQAEARILAEALLGPVGVEPLEDPLEGVGRDARAVVLDRQLDGGAAPAQGDPDAGTLGENERALSSRLLTT